MPVTKQGKVEYTDQEREYRDYMKGIKAPSRHTREQPMNREQALEYLRKVDDARRNLTTKEVESLGYAPGVQKKDKHYRLFVIVRKMRNVKVVPYTRRLR